jgi:uncharacterized protein
MAIPPRVSVVALRTVDLARSTAFYTALGWELSAASTPAMSLFKTAGSLLLVCTDELLAELGGEEVAAALAGEPNGEAVLSIHVATDEEVAAAIQGAAAAGGAVVKPPTTTTTPLGGAYAVFADPDGHLWEVIHHPLYRLGADGRPQIPEDNSGPAADRRAGQWWATSRGAGVGRGCRWRPSRAARSRPARQPAARCRRSW